VDLKLNTLSTESSAPLWTLSAALLLLLQLGALLLALFFFTGQSWLPSRRELEVINALAGRGGAAIHLQADDHVEWASSRCYGTCPAYRVSVDALGQVEFDGGFGTCRPGLQRRQIGVAQAHAVLAAAELALRDSVTEHSWDSDAPTADIATRVAGQRRQLSLTLGAAGSAQLHVQRFLFDASKVVLDPDWLPEWGEAGLSCKASGSKRVPFDPYMEGSPS
jgi:hypothetical protein